MSAGVNMRKHSFQLRANPSTAFARGVGMVEVLVALVVLGAGMLGMASLYVEAMRAKTTALSRTQAVNLANDIADRIRANRTATTAYDTSVATPANKGCTDSSVVAVNCSVADMAANDLWQWKASIAATLPGTSSGTLGVDSSTAPALYTVTIKWSEPTTGNQTYVLKVQI